MQGVFGSTWLGAISPLNDGGRVIGSVRPELCGNVTSSIRWAEVGHSSPYWSLYAFNIGKFVLHTEQITRERRVERNRRYDLLFFPEGAYSQSHTAGRAGYPGVWCHTQLAAMNRVIVYTRRSSGCRKSLLLFVVKAGFYWSTGVRASPDVRKLLS